MTLRCSSGCPTERVAGRPGELFVKGERISLVWLLVVCSLHPRQRQHRKLADWLACRLPADWHTIGSICCSCKRCCFVTGRPRVMSEIVRCSRRRQSRRSAVCLVWTRIASQSGGQQAHAAHSKVRGTLLAARSEHAPERTFLSSTCVRRANLARFAQPVEPAASWLRAARSRTVEASAAGPHCASQRLLETAAQFASPSCALRKPTTSVRIAEKFARSLGRLDRLAGWLADGAHSATQRDPICVSV